MSSAAGTDSAKIASASPNPFVFLYVAQNTNAAHRTETTMKRRFSMAESYHGWNQEAIWRW